MALTAKDAKNAKNGGCRVTARGNLPSPRLRRAGGREPFDLNGLTSLWVVLGCEFAPLTRGRLWASPELPTPAAAENELAFAFTKPPT